MKIMFTSYFIHKFFLLKLQSMFFYDCLYLNKLISQSSKISFSKTEISNKFINNLYKFIQYSGLIVKMLFMQKAIFELLSGS